MMLAFELFKDGYKYRILISPADVESVEEINLKNPDPYGPYYVAVSIIRMKSGAQHTVCGHDVGEKILRARKL